MEDGAVGETPFRWALMGSLLAQTLLFEQNFMELKHPMCQS